MKRYKVLILVCILSLVKCEQQVSTNGSTPTVVNDKLNNTNKTTPSNDQPNKIENETKAESLDIPATSDKKDEDDVPTFNEYQKRILEENKQKKMLDTKTPSSNVVPASGSVPLKDSGAPSGSSDKSASLDSGGSSSGADLKSQTPVEHPGGDTTSAGSGQVHHETGAAAGEQKVGTRGESESVHSGAPGESVLHASGTPAGTNKVSPGDTDSAQESRKPAVKQQQQQQQQQQQVVQENNVAQEKLQKNVAAVECGAKVLSVNQEAKNPGAVLSEDRDVYMNHPCSAQKWLVLELCEPVQVRRLELANYELFSSSPKTFNVSVSEKYPIKEWTFLGGFIARDERELQSFTTSVEEKFVRYMKFDFIDHYGQEHFCPLSAIRVFGVLTEDMDDEVDDSLPVVPPNLQQPQPGVIQHQQQQQQQIKPAEPSQQVGITSRIKDTVVDVVNSVKGVLQKDDTLQGVLSTKNKVVNTTTKSKTSHSKDSDECPPQDSSTRGGLLNSLRFALAEFQPYLIKCLNVLRSRLGVNVKRSVDEEIQGMVDQVTACKFYCTMNNISSSELARLYLQYNHQQLISSGDTPATNGDANLLHKDVPKIDTSVGDERSTSVSSEEYKSEDSRRLNPGQSVKLDAEGVKQTISNVETQKKKKVLEHSVNGKVVNDSVIKGGGNTTAGEQPLSPPVKLESPVPPVRVVPANGGRKECSAGIMRLTNRVKALELNISVSMRYLEELSRSYKKQTERVKHAEEQRTRHLQALVAHWERRARAAEVRESQLRSRISKLEARFVLRGKKKDAICMKRVESNARLSLLDEELRNVKKQLDSLSKSSQPHKSDKDSVKVLPPQHNNKIDRNSSWPGARVFISIIKKYLRTDDDVIAELCLLTLLQSILILPLVSVILLVVTCRRLWTRKLPEPPSELPHTPDRQPSPSRVEDIGSSSPASIVRPLGGLSTCSVAPGIRVVEPAFTLSKQADKKKESKRKQRKRQKQQLAANLNGGENDTKLHSADPLPNGHHSMINVNDELISKVQIRP